MRRSRLAAIGGVLAAAAGTLVTLARRPVPRYDRRLRLHGVGGRIEILSDDHAIPYIYAEDEADLFFAQGFVTARERLFQMDFLRRFAAGRLSELAGEPTLEIDRWQRTLGLRRSAERAWPAVAPDAREALVRYSAGVNAAIERAVTLRRLPLEFALLRLRPERWQPVDSISIIKIMALSLSVGWEADLLRDAMTRTLGNEAAEQAFPLPPASSPRIAAPGLAALRGIAGGTGGASNCWAIDGSRSASGHPLLATDPHLILRLPTIWYLNHLECPTLRAAGATLVGIPGVSIGHNDHGAWGITSGYADVQDIYVESVLQEGDGSVAFRVGGERVPGVVLDEEIVVRGREPHRERVVIGPHGPLISPLLPDETRDLALRWSCDEPDDAIGSLLAANRATDWASFRGALGRFGAPPLNLAWAGRDGRIGWLMVGHVPRRASGNGTLPLDGASGEEEWVGFLTLDEMPQAVDPGVGYLVHANNIPVTDDYPHWLGVDFMPGYRARRIEALITARASHDLDSFAAIQRDRYSEPEHRLARLVVGLPALVPPRGPLQKALTGWDGQMEDGSIAATIAHELGQVLLDHMAALAAPTRRAEWRGRVRNVELQDLLPHAFSAWSWLLERLELPEHPIWLEAGWSSPDELLIDALGEVDTRLRARLGDPGPGWRWGASHQRAIQHPLGTLPLIGRLVNRGPFAASGSAFSIDPDLGTVHRTQPLPWIGASVRFLFDTGDWDATRVALPGGNSGHPASRHYADLLPTWLATEHASLPWTRAAVDGAAVARMVIEPG